MGVETEDKGRGEAEAIGGLLRPGDPLFWVLEMQYIQVTPERSSSVGHMRVGIQTDLV